MARDDVTTSLMTEIGALEYMKQPLLMAIERVREAYFLAEEVERTTALPKEKKEEALEMINQSWQDVHAGLQEMRQGLLGMSSNLDNICSYIEAQLAGDTDDTNGSEP